MQSVNPQKTDRKAQTKLRVFPVIQTGEKKEVLIVADERCQTAASIGPRNSNTNFYSLLEFVPYQEIQKNSYRVYDLPRKSYVQWKLPGSVSATSSSESIKSSENSSKGSTRHTSFGSLVTRQNRQKMKSVSDSDTQTELRVAPHVLEEDEVATVYGELATQTSLTFNPDASKTKIVILLQENLTHLPGSTSKLQSNTNEIQATYQSTQRPPTSTELRTTQTEAVKNDNVDLVHLKIKNLVDGTVLTLERELKEIMKIYNESKQGEKPNVVNESGETAVSTKKIEVEEQPVSDISSTAEETMLTNQIPTEEVSPAADAGPATYGEPVKEDSDIDKFIMDTSAKEEPSMENDAPTDKPLDEEFAMGKSKVEETPMAVVPPVEIPPVKQSTSEKRPKKTPAEEEQPISLVQRSVWSANIKKPADEIQEMSAIENEEILPVEKQETLVVEKQEQLTNEKPFKLPISEIHSGMRPEDIASKAICAAREQEAETHAPMIITTIIINNDKPTHVAGLSEDGETATLSKCSCDMKRKELEEKLSKQRTEKDSKAEEAAKAEVDAKEEDVPKSDEASQLIGAPGTKETVKAEELVETDEGIKAEATATEIVKHEDTVLSNEAINVEGIAKQEDIDNEEKSINVEHTDSEENTAKEDKLTAETTEIGAAKEEVLTSEAPNEDITEDTGKDEPNELIAVEATEEISMQETKTTEFKKEHPSREESALDQTNIQTDQVKSTIVTIKQKYAHVCTCSITDNDKAKEALKDIEDLYREDKKVTYVPTEQASAMDDDYETIKNRKLKLPEENVEQISQQESTTEQPIAEELNVQDPNNQESISQRETVVGDNMKNKQEVRIACECQLSPAGAAPPGLHTVESPRCNCCECSRHPVEDTNHQRLPSSSTPHNKESYLHICSCKEPTDEIGEKELPKNTENTTKAEEKDSDEQKKAPSEEKLFKAEKPNSIESSHREKLKEESLSKSNKPVTKEKQLLIEIDRILKEFACTCSSEDTPELKPVNKSTVSFSNQEPLKKSEEQRVSISHHEENLQREEHVVKIVSTTEISERHRPSAIAAAKEITNEIADSSSFGLKGRPKSALIIAVEIAQELANISVPDDFVPCECVEEFTPCECEETDTGVVDSSIPCEVVDSFLPCECVDSFIPCRCEKSENQSDSCVCSEGDKKRSSGDMKDEENMSGAAEEIPEGVIICKCCGGDIIVCEMEPQGKVKIEEPPGMNKIAFELNVLQVVACAL